MICPKCDRQMQDDARFCPECGAYVPPAGETQAGRAPGPSGAPGGRGDKIHPRVPPRSPHICWWNLLVSGLAQMIHGQMGKGVLWLSLTIASNMLFPLLPAVIIGIASVVDAFMVGKTLQKGVPVGKWEWFPRADGRAPLRPSR